MDKIKFTILESGVIKIETDKVSAANHVGAEAFLRECISLAGGRAERKLKHGHTGHTHSHGDGIEHTH